MDRRGEVDFTHRVYAHFSTDLIPRVTSSESSMYGEFIIPIEEFRSFIFSLSYVETFSRIALLLTRGVPTS